MSTPSAQSLADFYAGPASPYAAFPQEHRSGGSMPVTIIRADQDAHDTVDPAVPEISLALSLKSEMGFRWDVGDGLTEQVVLRTGQFCFAPANTAVRFDCHDPHTVLVLNFPDNAAAAVLADHNLGSLSSFDALTGQTFFSDRALRQVALQMWAESARKGGASDLLMDGLTQTLFARLLDKAGQLRPSYGLFALGQTEMARVEHFIEDQLAERITVETLAALVDMPRWTFADAFKATTGETPHAYVTTKRINRACDLLRLGDMPLAEIAYATGFASQSHMTDTFRRVLGTTPGKWRAEVRT